jgi:hypothetical protein
MVRSSHGSCFTPSDVLGDHARLAHRELVALAAHVLDEDREVQLAAPRDEEHVGVGRLLDAQRHVREQLAVEALAQLAARHVLAFLPGER